MFDVADIGNFFRKHFNKKDLLFIIVIAAGYFLTRIINLKGLPIFGDEGIYIHWAKVAWHDAAWRFVSLTDGKQPIQTWATIPLLKLFPNDALFAGRLFSVLTGFTSLVGIFSLLFLLFNKKSAYLGSLLYIFIPYFMFYDRMALADSGVNAAFIWIFFFSVLLVKTLRFDVALLFGLVAGFGLLTKSSVRIFVYLSGLAPLMMLTGKFRVFVKKTVNYWVLFAVAGLLALAMYNIQRLSPFLHFVEEKNKTFVLTLPELLKAPFDYVRGNLISIPYYIVTEAGLLLLLLGLAGLALLIKKNWRLGVYILIWIAAPYVAIAFFTKVLFPRYIIFFASLLLITTVYLFDLIRNGKLKSLIVILFIASFLYSSYTVIFDQKNIPLPPVDRGQYIEGVTAGWGIPNIVNYAREKSSEKPVILLAEGNFGVIGDQLDVFLRKDDKIFLKSYWPLDEKSLLENQKEVGKNYVYVVFSHRQEFPKSWPITLIKRYEKPYSDVAIYFYQLSAK